MELCFIVEGNSNIGLGHIMRCIALAKEFRRRGFNIYFYSLNKEGVNKIEENNFTVINKLNKYNVIIVDKYELSYKFFHELKKYTHKLVYIDDLNEFDYPVDIVVNGSLIANDLNYEKYNNKNKKLLLGTKYNLLRNEFNNLTNIAIKKKVEDIMITTGGSDSFGMTYKLATFIRENSRYNNIKLHIVIGSGFNNITELKLRLNCLKNIKVYQNVSKMSIIMNKCDIAISAGGGTLYELCACGVVTIGFILAKNQEMITNRMDELGYIKSIGWYSEVTNKELTKALDYYINNLDERIKKSIKQKMLVDGKGTRRVVDEIIKILCN